MRSNEALPYSVHVQSDCGFDKYPHHFHHSDRILKIYNAANSVYIQLKSQSKKYSDLSLKIVKKS